MPTWRRLGLVLAGATPIATALGGCARSGEDERRNGHIVVLGQVEQVAPTARPVLVRQGWAATANAVDPTAEPRVVKESDVPALSFTAEPLRVN